VNLNILRAVMKARYASRVEKFLWGSRLGLCDWSNLPLEQYYCRTVLYMEDCMDWGM